MNNPEYEVSCEDTELEVLERHPDIQFAENMRLAFGSIYGSIFGSDEEGIT